ncbi:10113_t:CDS:2 [Rhizophagus irregularis]|nr:10113_t:CDS:2 [Rhizophagus irregularis]
MPGSSGFRSTEEHLIKPVRQNKPGYTNFPMDPTWIPYNDGKRHGSG